MPAQWLKGVETSLAEAGAPVTFFFRDDDAGWRDDRLLELLDRFERRRLPLDVAVIPCALGESLAEELKARQAGAAGRLGLHQHGFSHANHEPEGRKQEFGPSRSHGQQRRDVQAGRARLEALLGAALDPIFTPPWNRCTALTGRCLTELGVRVLSREARAVPLGLPGLAEVPVHVDWFAKRKGVRLTREEVGAQLAAAAASGGPVGVMFHHAVMDEGEMADADELLALIADHQSTRCVPIMAVAESLGERGPQALPGRR